MSYDKTQVFFALVGIGGERLLAKEDDMPEYILFVGFLVDGVDDRADKLRVAHFRAD